MGVRKIRIQVMKKEQTKKTPMHAVPKKIA